MKYKLTFANSALEEVDRKLDAGAWKCKILRNAELLLLNSKRQ